MILLSGLAAAGVGASASTVVAPHHHHHHHHLRRHMPRALSSHTKAVYQGKFPLTAEFRSGPRGYKKSYEDWVEKQLMPHGHAVDLQTNVLRFEPENWKYANRFAEEHPETMVLSTWRAASGTPKSANDDGDPLGVSTISFPGHWVLSPGSTLASNIFPSSETIPVASTNNMRVGPAILVETTFSGEKLWDRFEYVLIQRVNEGSSVEVRREFNGSPAARSFPAFSSEILPMPWDDRNRIPYVDWFFNFSRYCPRDANGDTAMDIILREMVEPLRDGGPLDKIAGIDLASGPLTVNPEEADYDLDGNVDEDAVYREGVETFYKRIRSAIGEEGVLTTSLDYEFSEYINGVNQEGLANPNDPWEHVTRTVNNVLSWDKFAKLPVVGLAFQQHMDREETLLRVQLQRLLSGYSVCLGMAADVEDGSGYEALDELKRIELYKGDAAEPHWLGKALGMHRPASMTPNLLNGSNSEKKDREWDTIMPSLRVNRGSLYVNVDGDELVLKPNEGSFKGYLTLDLEFSLDEKTDFVVYMEAISDDDHIRRKILLPRISVDVEHEASRAELTSMAYLPLSFYVRGASAGSVTFGLRFDHGGDVRFRSLSVHKAADTLACEFENGVVLVNPSLNDATFNLNEIFPGRTGFQRLSASVPNGAAAIPTEYLPQLRQAMELNNGQWIGNKQSLPVPQRNALFLIADSVAVTDDVTKTMSFESSRESAVNVIPSPVSAPAPIPSRFVEAVLTREPTEAPTRDPTSRPTSSPTLEQSTGMPTKSPTVKELSDEEIAWEALGDVTAIDTVSSGETASLDDEMSILGARGELTAAVAEVQAMPQTMAPENSEVNRNLIYGVGVAAAVAVVAIGFAIYVVRTKKSHVKLPDDGSVVFSDANSKRGAIMRMETCASSDSTSDASIEVQRTVIQAALQDGECDAIEVGFGEIHL